VKANGRTKKLQEEVGFSTISNREVGDGKEKEFCSANPDNTPPPGHDGPAQNGDQPLGGCKKKEEKVKP